MSPHRVLVLTHTGLDFVPLTESTPERLYEALPEVVAEAGVQQRVERTVEVSYVERGKFEVVAMVRWVLKMLKWIQRAENN